MGRRKVAIIAGASAAAIALTLGVTLTRGGDAATADATDVAGLTAYVANNSDGDRGDRGIREQIRELMGNDDFRADVNALRDERQAAMEKWWDTYGDDPDGDAAREAREGLRDEQRAAMNKLLEKYGVDTSAAEEAREAAQAAREKLQKLMADDDFRADLNDLRDEQQAAMEKWWDEYGDEPRSDAAREAMDTLRDDARADMERLLEKYGVELPEGFGGRGPGGHGGGLMDDGFGPMDGGPGGGPMGGGDRPPADGGASPEGGSTTAYSL